MLGDDYIDQVQTRQRGGSAPKEDDAMKTPADYALQFGHVETAGIIGGASVERKAESSR